MSENKRYYEYPEYKDKLPPTEVKILCPFCNAPWTAEMELALDSVTEGCDSCGYGAEATITQTIYCSNCHCPIYMKESTIS